MAAPHLCMCPLFLPYNFAMRITVHSSTDGISEPRTSPTDSKGSDSIFFNATQLVSRGEYTCRTPKDTVMCICNDASSVRNDIKSETEVSVRVEHVGK